MSPKTIGLIAHTGKPGVGDLVNAIVQEFDRFSIKIEIEKRSNSLAMALTRSATAGLPVCAIKPIVFGRIQKIPDYRPHL